MRSSLPSSNPAPALVVCTPQVAGSLAVEGTEAPASRPGSTTGGSLFGPATSLGESASCVRRFFGHFIRRKNGGSWGKGELAPQAEEVALDRA